MEQTKKYAKNYVQLVCTKQVDNQRFYLIYKRKVAPFLGCTGFPSGKIEWGEIVLEAASRELLEETGLKGVLKIKAQIHYIFNDIKGNIVDDQYMYICHIDEPAGEVKNSDEGENYWVSEDSFTTELKMPFVPIENYLRIINLTKDNSDNISFFEVPINTQNY